MKKIFLSLSLVLINAYANEPVDKEDPLYYGTTSKNFVLRWSFQEYCDHVFDPRTNIWAWPTKSQGGVTFDPALVKPADVVFARDLDLFFRTLHPKIQHPYILVTHGEYLDAMKKHFANYLNSDKVIAWFGIHPHKSLVNNPKYIPIPLGVVQQPDNYKKSEQLHNFFNRTRLNTENKYLLYMNIALAGKPEREKVRALFIKEPYCKNGSRKPFFDYLKEMACAKFSLSPKGLGPDCYRTWEALLVGSIPIVRSSHLDVLYEGLPVLIVEKWEDINEEYLNKKFKEITSKKYDLKRLYMEYWTEKIENVRKKYLASHK